MAVNVLRLKLILIKKKESHLLRKALSDTTVAHTSGPMQEQSFSQWIIHFISIVKLTTDDHIVSVPGGHNSRTRNIDVVQMARSKAAAHPAATTTNTKHAETCYGVCVAPEISLHHKTDTWLKAHHGLVTTHW